MSNIPLTPLDDNNSPLEQIKRIDPDGNEYWSARDLRKILGYASWRQMVVSCLDIYVSFCIEDNKQKEMVLSSKKAIIGSGAIRKIDDWNLSEIALDRLFSRVASHKPE